MKQTLAAIVVGNLGALLACVLFGAAYGAVCGAAYGSCFGLYFGTFFGAFGGMVMGCVSGVVGFAIGGPRGWCLAGVLGAAAPWMLMEELWRDPLGPSWELLSLYCLTPALIGGGLGYLVGFGLWRGKSGLPGVERLGRFLHEDGPPGRSRTEHVGPSEVMPSPGPAGRGDEATPAGFRLGVGGGWPSVLPAWSRLLKPRQALILATTLVMLIGIFVAPPLRIRRSPIAGLSPCTIAGPYPGYNSGICIGHGIVIEWP